MYPLFDMHKGLGYLLKTNFAKNSMCTTYIERACVKRTFMGRPSQQFPKYNLSKFQLTSRRAVLYLRDYNSD